MPYGPSHPLDYPYDKSPDNYFDDEPNDDEETEAWIRSHPKTFWGGLSGFLLLFAAIVYWGSAHS